jgi:UDP-3-O-[3-hydroxymyristoyl] glucosamine N-acyltransferase
MALTLGELADRIHATLSEPAKADVPVTGCESLADADESHVSFLHHPKYLDQLRKTRAAAVIVAPNTEADGKTLLIADDPYYAFRNAAIELHGWRQQPHPGVHPDAYIDETAALADLCTIRPFAYIAPRARIGRRCIIYPGVYVGKDAIIGDDCILHPNVTVYDHCVLGNRVTLHAGCVIGQDGFGYATHNGTHHKIPTPGNAVIEDDVEMGATCSVDRATVGSTVIGQGTKFSNSVTIGHGCRVGKHNLFVAGVGLAGSVTTGDYVVMGGQVGVAGHLTIGDRVQIAAKSGVATDLPADEKYGGTPAVPLTQAKRQALAQQQLPDLIRRVKALEKQLKDRSP